MIFFQFLFSYIAAMQVTRHSAAVMLLKVWVDDTAALGDANASCALNISPV